MTYEEIVDLLNTDPVVQELLNAPIPARLAYVAPDNSPRAIPISYLWNGREFVFASPPTWFKIRAITANPHVAFTVDTQEFPPRILMVRGVATIEHDQGLPEEYVAASRRIVGEEKFPAWEAEARSENRNMAVIRVRPTWVKVVDFETRFPGPDSPAVEP